MSLNNTLLISKTRFQIPIQTNLNPTSITTNSPTSLQISIQNLYNQLHTIFHTNNNYTILPIDDLSPMKVDGCDLYLPTQPPIYVKIFFESEFPFLLNPMSNIYQEYQLFLSSHHNCEMNIHNATNNDNNLQLQSLPLISPSSTTLPSSSTTKTTTTTVTTTKMIILVSNSPMSFIIYQHLQMLHLQQQQQLHQQHTHQQQTFILIQPTIIQLSEFLYQTVQRFTLAYQRKSYQNFVALQNHVMSQDIYTLVLQSYHVTDQQQLLSLQDQFPTFSSLHEFNLIDHLNQLNTNIPINSITISRTNSVYHNDNFTNTTSTTQLQTNQKHQNKPLLNLTSILASESILNTSVISTPHIKPSIYSKLINTDDDHHEDLNTHNSQFNPNMTDLNPNQFNHFTPFAISTQQQDPLFTPFQPIENSTDNSHNNHNLFNHFMSTESINSNLYQQYSNTMNTFANNPTPFINNHTDHIHNNPIQQSTDINFPFHIPPTSTHVSLMQPKSSEVGQAPLPQQLPQNNIQFSPFLSSSSLPRPNHYNTDRNIPNGQNGFMKRFRTNPR